MCHALRNSLHHSGTYIALSPSLPQGKYGLFIHGLWVWPPPLPSLPPSTHSFGLEREAFLVLCCVPFILRVGMSSAFWCGRDVVLRRGEEFRARFGSSILRWIPNSVDPLVRHACTQCPKAKKNPIINGIRPRWGFRLSDFHFLSGSVAPPKNPLLQPFILPSCYHGEFALILRRSLPGVVQFLENGNWLNFNLCINQESTDSFIDLSETERSFENTEKFSINCIAINLRSVNGAKRTSK